MPGNPGVELTWIGKERRPQQDHPVLLEDTDQGYRRPGPAAAGELCDNRLIFGDNLLALAALEAEFAGQIRCIFIDPPYNTGSAFSHYDDALAHSRWLSMMRDRLELLVPLLAPDGFLYISVDDHEAHYLKVLCDEMMGRRNFLATVIWQKKYTQANDARFFSDNHDYILVYARDIGRCRLNRLPRDKQQDRAYTNPDHDPRGPWKATPLHAKSGTAAGFSFTFRNGVSWRPPPGTFPRFSEENLRRMDENSEIWFGKNGTAVPARKTFLSGVQQGMTPKSLWLFDEVGHNHEARTEARAIVPHNPFGTPKPERLLARILSLSTQPGDWVLDAFAGSGTTGAVAHKMGRRWIMIEIGDHCHTHVVPRLKMVIDGEDEGGISRAKGWSGGGGYRYFRMATHVL